MNDLIVHTRRWKAALTDRPETSLIASQQILEYDYLPTRELGDHASAEILAELRMPSSGVVPMAILGATYQPAAGSLLIRVVSSGEYTPGGIPRLPSKLAEPLISGLPLEYATVVLDEIAKTTAEMGFPGGMIEVNRGGYDEVDSSEFAFRKTARFLTWALLTTSSSGFPTDDEVSLFLEPLQV